MKRRISELENRIEALEKQAAAGTATPQKTEQINLKVGGYCRIDNVTEGYHVDGPATIIIIREIN